MEALTRGQLAQQGRVNAETIRYYERRGLLPKAPRTPAGYRTFDREAVQRIRFIKQAQALGFSLGEIRDLLRLRIDPRRSCGEVRARAEAKLADIEEKLRRLHAMKKTLARFVAACAGRGPVSECPILEALDEERANIRPRTKPNHTARR
jgi:MerR family mercuric resistance operon transcriptional regulator